MDIRKSDDVTEEPLSSQLEEKKISSEAKKSLFETLFKVKTSSSRLSIIKLKHFSKDTLFREKYDFHLKGDFLPTQSFESQSKATV